MALPKYTEIRYRVSVYFGKAINYPNLILSTPTNLL